MTKQMTAFVQAGKKEVTRQKVVFQLSIQNIVPRLRRANLCKKKQLLTDDVR
jgi:hypothetical protein